jgi:hypothetical protein
MPHAAGDGARRMDYALDIDPALARNRLGVVFVERAAPRHAGIVYEDRERAELLFRFARPSLRPPRRRRRLPPRQWRGRRRVISATSSLAASACAA